MNNDDPVFKAKALKQLVKMISSSQKTSQDFLVTMMKDNYDNEEYWKYILEQVPMSTAQILNNIHNINLAYLIKFQHINDDCLTHIKFMTKILEDDLVNDLLKYRKIPIKTIEYFIVHGGNTKNSKTFFSLLSSNQHLPKDFIEIYQDHLDWEEITMHQEMTLDFLTNYIDRIVWKRLPLNTSACRLINNNTIKLFDKYPIWDNIGCLSGVSTDVIFSYFAVLTKESIITLLKVRELTTEQIKQIIYKYDDIDIWTCISMISNLEDEIIDRYSDKLVWDELSTNYDFSTDQLNKYSGKINYELLSTNFNFNSNWLAVIKANGLYDKLDVDFLDNIDAL
jgi:hypothetical protein